MNRRLFLQGMVGILAAGVAPSIITTPGLLMPVRKIAMLDELTYYEQEIVIDQMRVPSGRIIGSELARRLYAKALFDEVSKPSHSKFIRSLMQ